MREFYSYLFESLAHDPSVVIETEDGQFLLNNNWDAYWGDAVSSFIDCWLPRKVIGNDDLQNRAPGILRKWLTWCYQHNYISEEQYKDFMDVLPRGKTKDVRRLQKAGELLYRLHAPDPGTWMTENFDKVVSINRQKAPEEIEEGYMKIIRLGNDSADLETEQGKKGGL